MELVSKGDSGLMITHQGNGDAIVGRGARTPGNVQPMVMYATHGSLKANDSKLQDRYMSPDT